MSRRCSWCVEVVVGVWILEVGSSLLTHVYNTYNNSDNNRSNPHKLNVFLSNETP